ncbi:MAG: DHH family phosphoesterase [Patescibacteria group bacterium]
MFNAIHTEIITALQQANHVLIISHRKPDGDTIGAGLAIRHYCHSLNKPVQNYCLDPAADYFHFLPEANTLGPQNNVWLDKSIDVIVVVDAGDLGYAGVAEQIAGLPQKYTLINIDHHVTNTNFGQINLVASTASSACEVVYHLLESVRAIDHTIATCLLTGLITDTGNLTNLATTASAVQVASRLVSKGANLAHITKQALNHRTYTTLKLWGRALQRLHEDAKTGMVVTTLTLEDLLDCQADDEDISGISNFLNGLDQSADKAILVLVQTAPDVIKGSLRTTNPLLDVTEFAKLYGGGGHKKAAGFTTSGTLTLTPTGYAITPSN